MLGKVIFSRVQDKWYGRRQRRFSLDLGFREAVERFQGNNELHRYMHHYFYNYCPRSIREHRTYFEIDQRGFGERAFHAMWWLLMKEFQPRICLEIGVYRGQVISLWGVIAQLLGYPCEIHGLSPFRPLGDTVSSYREDVDYLEDTLKTFKFHNLPAPMLKKALSTDVEAIDYIRKVEWDLIYIDGSHEYDVVLKDYFLSCKSLKPGGILVVDDSSLGTAYSPPAFSFAGHPGPSRVVTEFAMNELEFLGAVGHNNLFLNPAISVPLE